MQWAFSSGSRPPKPPTMNYAHPGRLRRPRPLKSLYHDKVAPSRRRPPLTLFDPFLLTRVGENALRIPAGKPPPRGMWDSPDGADPGILTKNPSLAMPLRLHSPRPGKRESITSRTWAGLYRLSAPYTALHGPIADRGPGAGSE